MWSHLLCHAVPLTCDCLPSWTISYPLISAPPLYYITFLQCYPTKIYVFMIPIGLATLILPPFLVHTALNTFIAKLDAPDTCKWSMLTVDLRRKTCPHHHHQLHPPSQHSNHDIPSSFVPLSPPLPLSPPSCHDIDVDLPNFDWDYTQPISDNNIEPDMHQLSSPGDNIRNQCVPEPPCVTWTYHCEMNSESYCLSTWNMNSKLCCYYRNNMWQGWKWNSTRNSSASPWIRLGTWQLDTIQQSHWIWSCGLFISL